MKKYHKGHQPIFKDLTDQEAYDQLNKQYPIKLKYQEDLIDRIYSRYPYLNKVEIAIIVKTTFEGMRYFLLIGKNLHFKKISNIFRFIYTFRSPPKWGLYGYLYAKVELLEKLLTRTSVKPKEKKDD